MIVPTSNHKVADYSDNRSNTGIHKEHGDVLMSVKILTGQAVFNRKNEYLGKIKDIILGLNTGRICYAVLSFHSLLAIREKLFPVPWNALNRDDRGKRFILDLDKKRRKNAPGYNKIEWPHMAEKAWSSRIHHYYQTKPVQ